MNKDRKLIIISLIIAIACLISFHLPISVALLMLLIPVLIFYALKVNDFSNYIEFKDKKILKELRQKQIIHTLIKVRPHATGSEWYIRNNSSFDWEHAIVYLEHENANGSKATEKHHIHNLNSFDEQTLLSSKKFIACERKRILIVTNKGYSLKIPFLWKPVHDWSQS